ncbi:MAG: FIG01964566: Predicted membrane protein, hemolysin III homolog, partial [uncultured Friedmanniella sp.]
APSRAPSAHSGPGRTRRRGAGPGQAPAPRLAARLHGTPGAGRRGRAGGPGAEHRREGGRSGVPRRVGAALRHQRSVPPAHLGAAGRGRDAPPRPRQHLRLHRGQLHPDGPAHARGRLAGPAALADLVRGARRAVLPAVLARRAPLALHRALHRDGLGRGRLDGRLLRGRRAGRAAADPARRAVLHRRCRRLRAQAPRSLPHLVRLPRDLPRGHGAGLRQPLRRHLAAHLRRPL